MRARTAFLAPAILVALALAPAALPASIPEIPDPEAGGMDPRQLVGFRTCEVTEVREGRILVVLDEGDGAEHVLRLSPKLKIRAQAKKDFDGRRKLAFEDLDVGHRVKVSYRKSDGTILGVDVLKRAAE